MTTNTIYEVPEDCKCVDGDDLLDLMVFLEYANVEYCEICGWSLNIVSVGSHKICRHCLTKGIENGTIVSCSRCGEVLFKDEATLFETEDNYVVFCDECAHACIGVCSDCGKKFIREWPCYVTDEDGYDRTVCPSCIENYNRCMECGKYFDYTLEEGMCHRCIDSFRWYGDSERHDYHDWGGKWNYYNNDGSITRRPQNNETIYLGVELEINNDYDCEDDMYNLLDDFNSCLGGLVHYERDGSLNEWGIEIITMPMTIEKHMEYIGRFRDAFSCAQNYSYFCSHDTGLHVHVSTTMMERKHHKRLLYMIDKFIQNVANLSRRVSSDYAGIHTIAEVRGKRGEPEWVPNGYDLEKYLDWITDHQKADRYTYINYTKWNDTIEFRMFQGTLDWRMYLGYIQFVYLCIRASMSLTLNKLREMSFEDIFVGKYEELDYLISATKHDVVRLPTW